MSGRRKATAKPLRTVAGEKVDGSTMATPEHTTRGNLPLELSSFVGREREISEVERLLADTRLLTLTGTGGCGKTRLALKVATNLAEEFDHGVWWVRLAPLADPALVPKSVASALGVREQPGRSMTEALCGHLRSGELLLVLDNCEHLIEACAALVEALLRTCPNVRILATSREFLSISGETNWPVPSLSLPNAHRLLPVQELMHFEAIRLFVERAADARPGLEPTEHDALALVEVCRELEGIPLAIELAAARTKVLTVRQIAERLDDSFQLLAGGSRTVLPRQKTLRATIDWSHDLLSEGERTLLRRLSVFAGGFTLEAAEEVCSGKGIEQGEAFDLVTRLVDKSLVMAEVRDTHARYRLLETIRQYASEKLRESGETKAIRQRHADSFLSLVEVAGPAMAGPELAAWLGRLDQEHENLREALGWLEEEREVERGLRLASAPLRFWWIRGHLAEGRARLEALLNLHSVVPVRDEVRARALHVLGVLIYRHADYPAGDGEAARSHLEASLEVYRRLRDEAQTAAVLQDLGRISIELGEWMAAQAFLEESLTIGRRLNNPYGIALSLLQIGWARFCGGELSQARAHLEESLEMFRELDDRFCINACLCYLGYIDSEEGAHSAARSRYLQINGTFPVLQSRWGNTYMLEGFARLAAAEGQATRALHLGGATVALRETFGVSIGPGSEALFRRSLEPAWQALGEEAGMEIWGDGRAMTLEEALAFALEEPTVKPDRKPGGVLSTREAEVLSFVAEGLTDVQIAERLYLSRRTVGHHLSSAYRKLGVKGRSAAVYRAGEMGLL